MTGSDTAGTDAMTADVHEDTQIPAMVGDGVRFDYGGLSLKAEQIAEVEDLASEIRHLYRKTLAAWIAIGSGLIRARTLLGPSAWVRWVRAEFAWTERHARNMAAVAEYALSPRAPAEIISVLPPTSVLALARAPERVQADVVELVHQGDRPTAAEIKAMVKEVRRKPPKPPREAPDYSYTLCPDEIPGSDVDDSDDGPCLPWDTDPAPAASDPRDAPDDVCMEGPERFDDDEDRDEEPDPEVLLPTPRPVRVELDDDIVAALTELAREWHVSTSAAARHVLGQVDTDSPRLRPPRGFDPASVLAGFRPRMASFFSGIDYAFHKGAKLLGWVHASVSQWDPEDPHQHAATVLATKLTDVPNLGDVTAVTPDHLRGGLEVIVGGPPCQSFSGAGKQEGMASPKGHLTKVFLTLATQTPVRVSYEGVGGFPVVLMENVPRLLSNRYQKRSVAPDAEYDDREDAFAWVVSYVSGLAGHGRETDVVVPRPRAADGTLLAWPSAGLVSGPQRHVGWRVLDATMFGLPQKRLRVYIVATRRGDGIDPLDVLFDRPITRGDAAWTDGRGHGFWPINDAQKGPVNPEPLGNRLSDVLTRAPDRELETDEHGDYRYVMPRPSATSIVEQVSAAGNVVPDWLWQALTLAADVGGLYDEALLLDRLGEEDRREYDRLMTRFDGAALVNFDSFGRKGSLTVREMHACTVMAHYGTGPTSRPHVVRRIDGRVCVRTLLVEEAEALMGVKKDWTKVEDWGRRRNQDALRYRALGNSLAVPVIVWLTDRIDSALRRAVAAGTFLPDRRVNGVVNVNEERWDREVLRRRAPAPRPPRQPWEPRPPGEEDSLPMSLLRFEAAVPLNHASRVRLSAAVRKRAIEIIREPHAKVKREAATTRTGKAPSHETASGHTPSPHKPKPRGTKLKR